MNDLLQSGAKRSETQQTNQNAIHPVSSVYARSRVRGYFRHARRTKEVRGGNIYLPVNTMSFVSKTTTTKRKVDSVKTHFIDLRFVTMKIIFSIAALATTASAFSAGKPAFTRPATTQLYGEFGASSTSVYTTTEKQDSYVSLEVMLDEKCKDEKIRSVIKDMLDVCADITEALRTALVTVEGSTNDFGDAQLSVDVSKIYCLCGFYRFMEMPNMLTVC